MNYKCFTILFVISIMMLCGCGRQNEIKNDTIIIEETLATDNDPDEQEESVSSPYIYKDCDKINDGKITNESSNYADIENLMNKISKETGGK